MVQGVFLGLVVDDRLEITNYFAFPQNTDDDADFDEGNPESDVAKMNPVRFELRTVTYIKSKRTLSSFGYF